MNEMLMVARAGKTQKTAESNPVIPGSTWSEWGKWNLYTLKESDCTTRADSRNGSVAHQTPAAHLNSSAVVVQLRGIGRSLNKAEHLNNTTSQLVFNTDCSVIILITTVYLYLFVIISKYEIRVVKRFILTSVTARTMTQIFLKTKNP